MYQEMSAVEREIEVLKLNVKETLVSESKAMDGEKKRILLIYLLISLGLAYHFEDEINKILTHSFKKIEDMMVGENDLYTVSILFWVFRTYGHNMSSGNNSFARIFIINYYYFVLLFWNIRRFRTKTRN